MGISPSVAIGTIGTEGGVLGGGGHDDLTKLQAVLLLMCLLLIGLRLVDDLFIPQSPTPKADSMDDQDGDVEHGESDSARLRREREQFQHTKDHGLSVNS